MAPDPIVIAGLVCFAIGIPFGLLLRLAWLKLTRLTKIRLFVLDSDGHDLSEFWIEPEGREVEVPKMDRRVILEGDCSYNGNTWMVMGKTGWNLRAPRRSEMEGKSLAYAIMAVSNPQSYHKEIRRHRWQETLDAGREVPNNSWIPLAIIAGFVLILIVLGGIGYIITHLPHAAAAVPTPTPGGQ